MIKCGCRLNAEGTIHAFVQSDECRMAEAVALIRELIASEWAGETALAKSKTVAFLAKVEGEK